MGLVKFFKNTKIKDSLSVIILVLLHLGTQELLTPLLEPNTNVAFFPLLMAGIGVAQGLASGAAASAAAARQNRQAMQQWVAGNTQKAFNNSRSQFQAAQQWSNQLKRNEEIARNAYAFSFDSRNAALAIRSFKQQQTSNLAMAQRASLLASVTARGLSGGSGSSTALKNAQAKQLLNENAYQNMEYLNQVKAIGQQEKNILSQQTENVFMPNIQGFDESPILQDTTAPMIGGVLSAVSGGLGGALDAMKFQDAGGWDRLWGKK